MSDLTPYPVPLTSHAAVLLADNIDTDQIIPARYLRSAEKDGLLAGLFADWRADPDFVLNQPATADAKILLTGDNFGCGSSREHAPWALVAWGFRALISTRFADIFKSNSLKNGLLPITVTPPVHAAIARAVAEQPSAALTVDLAGGVLRYPGGETGFSVDPFSRHCLLEGTTELGYLLDHIDAIVAHDARRNSE